MSDANPHIRHRVQMPNGEHVDVVYYDRRDASEAGGQTDPSRAHDPAAPTGGMYGADAAHATDPPPTVGPASTAGPAADMADAASLAEPEGMIGPAGTAEVGCGPRDLHVCFNCASELVYPLDWSEEGVSQWRIVLRCPECEARREGVFEHAVVERLDDELDRASGALLSDLKRITHANMSEEIEFFVRALDADLIVPSDFHR